MKFSKIYKWVPALFLWSCVSVSVSCTKWLNVQPEDRYTEEQAFSTVQGFEDAMNGIYIQMMSNNLYGANLTLTVPDVMAQYYKTNMYATHPFYRFSTYTYTDPDVQSRFSSIWSQAYLTIANINKLLENVDRRGAHVLSAERLKTMKGELLGLRGFVHFDLLRLYGPVYDSQDSTALAIPYMRGLEAEVQPFEPANKVLDYVLADLIEASTLLEADPSRTEGYRNLNNERFNYHAVQAAKARALLLRNDQRGAYEAAQKVVEDAALFPWIVGSKITANTDNPDRIFHTELLFAGYSNSLYENYNRYFYYEQTVNILAGGSSQFIEKVFEDKSGDYRFKPLWKVPPQNVGYYTFFKYADIVQKDRTRERQRNLIPLIRLSEMYYILAETETNPEQSLAYLNVVLNHRGLPSLEAGVDIDHEILKEYRKEFYGEGQLWYYYKRKKITSILSALTSNNQGTIPNTAWVVPIPNVEQENR